MMNSFQQACGKYMPATATVQANQAGTGMQDGTYLVEASF